MADWYNPIDMAKGGINTGIAGYNWTKDKLGFGNNSGPGYGTEGNPSNYNTGPDAGGFGGAGQIFGGGKVPLGGLNLPYYQQDRDRLGGMLTGQSPFAGSEWGALIGQLQQRASGAGPSLAGDAYRSAAMDTQNSLGSMARGAGTASAARRAMLEQGRVGQGMAQGYASARNQEMVGAQQVLSGALQSRDQLNQGAYLNILAQQLGLNDAQLRAGIANQQYSLGNAKNENDLTAAKWAAISGLLAGAGKMGTSTP